MRVRVLVLCLAAVLLAPAAAKAAAQWQSGPLVESSGYNCITAAPEQLAGTFLSYYADPANPPKTGEVYYVAIDVAGIGNPCAGQYADIELTLPTGTSTAISAAHPVECYLEFPGHNSFVRDSSSDCPQAPHTGAYGGLAFNPVGVSPGFWPLPQGGTVELHVPVVSSVALNGSSKLGGIVALADGESSPVLHPTLVTIVNDAVTQTGQNQIGILYPTPSITGQSPGGGGSVNVNIIGYVTNHSNPGSAVAQLGQPPHGGGTNCTSPVGPTGNPGGGIFSTGAVPLATGGANVQTQISGNFTTLYPGHAYCWRIVAQVGTPGHQVEYDGNWEPFITQGARLASDPEAAPAPIATPNCSASTGNGCEASPCSASGTCGQCAGAACLTSFAPGRSSIVATPPPPPTAKPPVTVSPPPAVAKITAKGKAKASRRGRSVLIATGLLDACPAGGAKCAVTLTAKVGKASVGSLHATIAAGKSLALKFKLNARGAKLLRSKHRLKIAVTVATAVGGAAPAPFAKTLTVKAPKR